MRIRTIKPEFWRSDDIASLPMDVRLLFVGLWSYVDDNGVGLDDHRRIAADLFAFEDDLIAIREWVRDGLATLSRPSSEGSRDPLIVRYRVDGKPYLYVTGWTRHQKIDKPGKPRYPLPPDRSTPGNPGPSGRTEGNAEPVSRDSRERLAPGTEEQGNRGTGEQGSSSQQQQHARTRDEHLDDPRLDHLRSALAAAGLRASWRNLSPDAAARVAALVDRHGPARLVKAAQSVHDPKRPARHVSAWIGLWDEQDVRPGRSAARSSSCDRCGGTGWIESLDDGLPIEKCPCSTPHLRAVSG